MEDYPSLESILFPSTHLPVKVKEKVPRLVEQCLNNIARNIKLYNSLEEVWDSYLLQQLMTHLKTVGKLNNSTLRLFMSASIELMDLEGVFLSDGSFQKLLKTCTGLISLNLRGNYSLMTPNNVGLMCKKLPHLKHLGLADGRYVTGLSHYFC